MYNTDTTIKVKQFTQEICNMLLKDLNKWVNELQAAPEAGKPVVIKYGSQYNNNQKANKLTNMKKDQDEASDPKKDADTSDDDVNESKNVRF